MGALLESAEKGQAVLPAINQAIEQVARVEEFFADYNRQLKMMGHEISQIADINAALDLQARNQQALLAELSKIVASIAVPEEVLRVLVSPAFAQAGDLCLAAEQLYGVLETKFDKGIREIRAVAERLAHFRRVLDNYEDALTGHLVGLLRGSPVPMAAGAKRRPERMKLCRLGALDQALLPLAPLIQLQARRAPEKFLAFRSAYEGLAKGTVTREMAEIIEAARAHHLLAKTPDEKPSFLLSSNRPSSAIDAGRVSKGTEYTGHRAFGDAAVRELQPQDKILPEQLVEYCLLLAVESSAGQFDAVAGLFHPEDTPQAHSLIGQILDSIYANMQDTLLNLAAELMRADRLVAFALLGLVDRRLPELAPEIPAMEATLGQLRERALAAAQEFTRAQLEAVQDARYSAKKRSGVFSYVVVFPRFVQVLERAIEGAGEGGAARPAVDAAYQQLAQAIFGSLNQLGLEASQTSDEKDDLNAAIMTVQNTSYLLEALRKTAHGNRALEPVLKQAAAEFAKNMAHYAELTLPRILGRLPEFFEGIRRLLATSSPEEVAFHAAYDKGAARRLLLQHPAKDMRRNVEAIHDRVLKHFRTGADGEALAAMVWGSLRGHVEQKVRDYSEIVLQVYAGSDVYFPVAPEDVAAMFA